MTARLISIIEALIFIAQEPITPERIRQVLSDFPAEDVTRALKDLENLYGNNQRGVHIQRTAGGYLFVTRPECAPWIKKMLHMDKKTRLSSAALETLSVIAYHQPITLAEISSIRGVDASHSLKTLLLKRLVKITGRKKSPGKPLIYRTSNKFLTYFGLNSLQDLPTQEEIEKILDEENSDA